MAKSDRHCCHIAYIVMLEEVPNLFGLFVCFIYWQRFTAWESDSLFLRTCVTVLDLDILLRLFDIVKLVV